MNQRKSNLLALIIILILPIGLNPKIVNSETENPGPFFSVVILMPSTCTAINSWVYLIADLLPTIGIEVSDLDETSWAKIMNRTWYYPGLYPIPTYEFGGYDIVKIPWTLGLEYNPHGFYYSSEITPGGDNVYQYNSSLMDTIIAEYTSSYNYIDKEFWAHEMQELFYEDQPSLTAFYTGSIFAYDSDFSGWNGSLWEARSQTMESWFIPGETEFHYAIPAIASDFFIYLDYNYWDPLWLNQIYISLFKRDPETKLWLPNIATDYNTTNGYNWTIYLNPNAKWADGNPITSDDVLFSFQVLLNTSYSYQLNRDKYHYITNESCSIIDSHTINFTFNNTAIFPEKIMDIKLIPKHIWESIEDFESTAYDWALSNPSKIIGAGPFILENLDYENKIVHLVRNNYYDDWTSITPHFNDIYFDFYSNRENALDALVIGNVQMVDSGFYIIQDEGPSSASYELVEEGGLQELALNNHHPYFGTGEYCPISGSESAKHIRKAMSHIIPREQIIEEIIYGHGFPGVTPYPNSAFGFDDSLEPYNYNLTKALEHMQAAGFDVTLSPIKSGIIGINFNIILGVIVLIGGIIHYYRKQKK